MCVMFALIASWLFYKIIDQSVTLDHQIQHSQVIIKQRNILVHMLNETSIKEPESKIRELLQRYSGESAFEKERTELVAEQVSFFFKDGHLVRVDVGADTTR